MSNPTGGCIVPLSISGRTKTSKDKKQVPMGGLKLQPVLVLLKTVFSSFPMISLYKRCAVPGLFFLFSLFFSFPFYYN